MTKNHSNFPLPTYYGFTGYLELPQTQNRYVQPHLRSGIEIEFFRCAGGNKRFEIFQG